MPKKNKGNSKRKGEGQLYDKIMRENLLELFLPLVAEELKFTFKKVTPLVDKQPTTVIRETDGFLLIETDSEKEPQFILHLEFESKDDADMVYRIMEYHGIELRKYRLPIKHVVIYLGEGKPTMKTKLSRNEVFEGFILVNAYNFSPNKWLMEEEPSKIIMAILGNYQKENAKLILEAIFLKLRKVCKTENELKKFIEQLIIISRMRNLEELTIKISEEMPVSIDIEKDYLYNLGLKKAEEVVKKTKEALLKARAERLKALEEKAALEAKALEEKAALEAKVLEEKAALEAKALEEKAALEAKALDEKTALEAKALEEKKASIAKMLSSDKFSQEEIMLFLNLDDKTFKQFIKEIEEDKKSDK